MAFYRGGRFREHERNVAGAAEFHRAVNSPPTALIFRQKVQSERTLVEVDRTGPGPARRGQPAPVASDYDSSRIEDAAFTFGGSPDVLTARSV
jgi:hypothetical protein